MNLLHSENESGLPVSLLITNGCPSDPEIGLALADLLFSGTAVSITIDYAGPSSYAGRNQIDPAILDKFVIHPNH
jgi:hypothetical protein